MSVSDGQWTIGLGTIYCYFAFPYSSHIQHMTMPMTLALPLTAYSIITSPRLILHALQRRLAAVNMLKVRLGVGVMVRVKFQVGS